jgi:hypothetical protein
MKCDFSPVLYMVCLWLSSRSIGIVKELNCALQPSSRLNANFKLCLYEYGLAVRGTEGHAVMKRREAPSKPSFVSPAVPIQIPTSWLCMFGVHLLPVF